MMMLRRYVVIAALAAVPTPAVARSAEVDWDRLRSYAADTWRSVAETVQPSGLPADGLHRDADGSWAPAPYTSPTNIAAYLWSTLAAEAMGLIGPDEAVDRLDRTLTALEGMERSRGFFYGWYDPSTAMPLSAWPDDGAPVQPFLSSVDNGWLAAAMIMVGNARPDLAVRTAALLGPMDFAFFYDPFDPADPKEHPGLFHIGYWPALDTFTRSHYGLLNTEARIISYIAIALGQVPPEHYARLRRTLSPECCRQHQAPGGEPAELHGVSVFQGHYTYRGLRVVPSWGGSMFEALMVTLFVPEADWAPTSWGINHPLYVRAQIEAGRDAGGFWGFSPAIRPGGGYAEYGVPGLGTKPGGYPSGDPDSTPPGLVVTPHASFLALGFAPVEAMENLAALAERFPIYDPFGFLDAVDVGSGRVAQGVLVLDQGMSLAAISNVLADRAMQRLFVAGPVEAAIRPLIAPERFTAGLAPGEPAAGGEAPPAVAEAAPAPALVAEAAPAPPAVPTEAR